MNEKKQQEVLENAKNVVVQSIAETMDLYGVTPSVGRLYGTMYFHNEPMSLDEMKDELGMSKPSMSSAVKALQEINIVQKTWMKGSRKEFFTSEKDFFRYFVQFFCKKWEREVDINLEAIEIAERELQPLLNSQDTAEDVKEEAQNCKHLLQESKRYYAWLTELISMLRSGEIYNYVPKPDKVDY